LSSNRCVVRMDSGRECGREVARGARCIFHLKEKTDEEAQQFDRGFLVELERLEKSEEPVIDLTGFVFPGELDMRRRTFSKLVIFEKATFSGSASLSAVTFRRGARFSRAVFSGEASFAYSTFLSEARFDGATFSGDAGFDWATFSGEARFDGAAFSGGAGFHEVTFSRLARFDGSKFLTLSGNAPFFGATFGVMQGHAWFCGATFSGGAWFGGATFSREARFDRVTFSGRAWFDDVTFSYDAWFPGATFSDGASFNGATFSRAAWFPGSTFSRYTSFNGAAFLRDAGFDDVTFATVIFTETTFAGRLFMGARFDGPAVFQRVLFQRDTIESSDLRTLLRLRPVQNVPLTIFSGASVGSNGEVRFIQPREYNAHLRVERNFAIDHVSFLNADLSRFNFQDVEWGRYHNRRAVIEEALMGRPPFQDVTPQQVRQVCARVRDNLERALRYPEAGDFFIGEMEMKRVSLAYDRPGDSRSRRTLNWLGRNVSTIALYKLLSMYGESWKLIAVWILASLFVLFPGGRTLASLISGSLCPNQLWNAYYVNFMRNVFVFFQLRSEDLFDVLERMWSGLLLGLTLVALRRQLERHRPTS